MLKQWFNTLFLLFKRHYIVTFSILIIICISVGIALSLGDKAYIYKDSVKRESKIVKGSTWDFYSFKFNVNGLNYSFGYYDFNICSCGSHPTGKLSRVSYKLDKYFEKGYFRIMKSEFNARPVYLSREDRIKAHFTTCFLALIIYRYLEKKLDGQYTTTQIIETLRDFNFNIKQYDYIPTYMRTNLTYLLHKNFKLIYFSIILQQNAFFWHIFIVKNNFFYTKIFKI